MASNYRILWADDEIDLLKPHIIFLRSRGYDVDTACSGADALDMAGANPYDLIILDENMPGISGLEALATIKQRMPLVPVIMITKSEEENIMDQALGSKIADYLIKPVNPNQILLAIKKQLDSHRLVSEQTSVDYRREFAALSFDIGRADSIEDWYALYRRLVFWEMQLATANTGMDEMLAMQRREANQEFGKWMRRRYESWAADKEATGRPLMSPEVMPRHVMPMLADGRKVFFVLIDNFRLDQWLSVKPLLTDIFSFDEQLYTSILPTATQYARNAIFSGLMPLQIASMFPDLWVDEEAEEGKNLNESPLLQTMFERYRRPVRFSYNKINDSAGAERLLRDFSRLEDNELNVIVVNFIDMLSHARTESKMIRELAKTDAAYRSITESWFRHSPVLELFRRIAARGYTLVLTTDHGTVRVEQPVKVVGDRNTNTNLRYKLGRNLAYDAKRLFEIRDPKRVGLPAPNLSTAYIFAMGQDFLAYPNNYNYYVQYYTGTFQHGGVSLEEMLVPLITMTPK
ncbi:MAG: PglZ domain-containing protein [Muribaculaceae bacterium]|nr:PglZ domain-containing protein [Muribaculaceae bacterium]